MAWNNAGSLAAVNGNANFVGTSTLLLGAFQGDALVYQVGTTFWLSEVGGVPPDNTHITTAENWPFSSGTIANGDWSILPCSPLRQSVATENAQLATLIANFSGVLSLTASDNTATLNKALTSNNAGVYLTTGGAAVARMGTFGDNSLRLSMSNGGGGYNDALIADPTSFLCTVYGDPTAFLGISTKQYTDGSSNAKVVRAASITNISISTPGTSIGGVTPANGERYLLAGETTASQNGLYVYNGASVAMTRCTDADSPTELDPATLVMVSEGTFANKVFILATAAPLVIGTTNLTFSRLDTLFFASPTFTGTATMPDSATWTSGGIAGLVKLGLGMSPSNILDITQNQNAISSGSILNNSSGTSAGARFVATNSTNNTYMLQYGQSATASGVTGAGIGLIACTGTLALAGGSGPILFAANGITESGRFDTNGAFRVGTTTQVFAPSETCSFLATSSPALGLKANATTTGTAVLGIYTSQGSGGAFPIAFFNGVTSTIVGSIGVNGSTTAFNTSSSEATKDDIVPMDADFALKMVRAYSPASYTEKATGKQKHGFVVEHFAANAMKLGVDAHDIGLVCVTREFSGMDYSKATPFLAKVANDHEDRIAALEAENAALMKQLAELTKKVA